MNILFMGTPDFAAYSLQLLHDAGHKICAAIAQPDKPKGRGMKLMPVPVKQTAESLGIPVYQPETLKNNAIMPLLEQYNPDLIVVVAYGKILPDYILEFPKYKCINLHGSLLPEYRGAAPIQRSVLDGKRIVGVTTMYMSHDMDAGDILLQCSIRLEENETSGELFEKLKSCGADLLVKTIRELERGNLKPKPQDLSKVTFAPMLTKEEAKIDWKYPASKIINMIRGYDPWPAAYAHLGDMTVKLFGASKGGECSGAPGEIAGVSKNGIQIVCGDNNAVVVKEIQASGSKRMSADDYFRGHSAMLKFKFE